MLLKKSSKYVPLSIKIAGKVLGAVGNFISGMLPEETAVQKVNKKYFNINEGGQRISGNPATDLYAGMNRNSTFGNLENAGNKRVATREKQQLEKGILKIMILQDLLLKLKK